MGIFLVLCFSYFSSRLIFYLRFFSIFLEEAPHQHLWEFWGLKQQQYIWLKWLFHFADEQGDFLSTWDYRCHRTGTPFGNIRLPNQLFTLKTDSSSQFILTWDVWSPLPHSCPNLPLSRAQMPCSLKPLYPLLFSYRDDDFCIKNQSVSHVFDPINCLGLPQSQNLLKFYLFFYRSKYIFPKQLLGTLFSPWFNF